MGFGAKPLQLDFYSEVKKMTKLQQNGLPVSIHHASGGDARVRSGGTNIQLTSISSGSFQVNGTRYKLFANMRMTSEIITLVGYTSPVTVANASAMLLDMQAYQDDVPEGTTVYFTLVNPSTLSPSNGSSGDYIYTSIYS
jgi:hypothetical protein